MAVAEEFSNQIAPFLWMEHEEEASVCLYAGEYLQELFDARRGEGFLGNGYDWESLARGWIREKAPELTDRIEFDSEAGMFCAYSEDREALRRFILGFKSACEDRDAIQDLLSRAEPG